MRRSGKSTYLYQVIQQLIKSGVSKQNILYLNFFDDRLHRSCNGDVGSIGSSCQFEEIEHPDPGEVIYVNRKTKRILCRRWNWRNADFSKLAPETRNLAITVDGMMPAIGRAEIEEAAESLKELLLRFCRGNISIHYLDAANPAVEFQFYT